MKKAVIVFLVMCVAFFVPYCIFYGKVHPQTQKVPETAESTVTTVTTQPETEKELFDFYTASQKISEASGKNLTYEMATGMGEETVSVLFEAAKKGKIKDADWYKLTGNTYNTLAARYGSAVDGVSVIDLGTNGKDKFSLGFTGDINFTEGSYVMPHAYKKGGVTKCIDKEFTDKMKAVDIMLINNEFTYSKRGKPLSGKQFTFRAKPESVKWLTELGVDVVSLANNHSFDYGEDSFNDTLDTLSKAGIPYVGAGRNYAEAARPVTYLINGYKVSFIAASRAEDYRLTPDAEDEKPGVQSTYDEDVSQFEAEISEVKENSDIVIVYVHWGIEGSTRLSDNEKRLAREYIDCGATAVIGAHPHILQGMEFYNGAPVVYSLGNFWFNTKSLDTCLLELTFDKDARLTMAMVPGRQENSEVKYISDAKDRRKFYDKVQNLPPDNKIVIDDNGVISAPKEEAA